jgi:hypothetical protein
MNNSLKDIVGDLKVLPLDAKNAVARLIQGGIMTLNFKRKKAYINYYVGTITTEVDWEHYKMIIDIDYIDMESGNLETGERHYYSTVRATPDELRTAKTINKFNL